jgi:hypothetical protein
MALSRMSVSSSEPTDGGRVVVLKRETFRFGPRDGASLRAPSPAGPETFEVVCSKG